MNREPKDEVFGDVAGSNFQPELEHTISNRWMTALTVNPDKAGVSRHDIIDALAVEKCRRTPGLETSASSAYV